MPVVEQTGSGGSNSTMMLSFLIGILIIAIAVLVILHAVLHIF